MTRIEWRPWITLGVLSLAGFMVTASTFSALGGVLPGMVKDLKLTWSEAGFGFTILAAACGGSSMAPAVLIRRLGVRATLLIGAAVLAAGFAALAVTRGVMLYFVGAALCGVGYQMMALIPGTYVLAVMFPKRGFPFGIYFTVGSLGGVAGPMMVWLITGVLHDGWRVFWLVQVVATIAVGVLCASMVGRSAWLAEAAARTDRALAEDAARPGRRIRSEHAWTPGQALRTPQFLVLLAAYFGHLLVGGVVVGLSVAHLTQRGVATGVALGALSLEALVQTGGRAAATALGDRLDPRLLLLFALGALVVGAASLSIANSYPLMLLYAVGSGLGFGLTALAVTELLLDYFGRKHNLEIFSLTCLVGAVSALGPFLGGWLRDLTGGFSSVFQICAALIGAVFIAAFVMRPPRWEAGA